VSIFYT